MSSLLVPWLVRAPDLGNATLIDSIVAAEQAWLSVMEELSLAPAGIAKAASAAWISFSDRDIALEDIGQRSHESANVVIPVVAQLRAALATSADDELAWWVHRGLTSQDALDTALMSMAATAVKVALSELMTTGDSLVRLARASVDTPALARTLGQPALPTTWGVRISVWLNGIREVHDDLRSLELPVQCGGAAGTSAALVELGADPVAACERWAQLLGLSARAPWHTTRFPVVRIATACAQVITACSHIASDVVLQSRAESGELAEPVAPGRGGSSSMPHKVNPVLSVQLRAIAIQAPNDLATVVAAAGLVADERPDGAWHAEWAPLQRLLASACAAASITAEITSGLRINAAASEHNLHAALPTVLSEQAAIRRDHSKPADPGGYLGNAHTLVDNAIRAWERA